MIYLMEKHTLCSASPRNLDRLVERETERSISIYEQNGAELMAAWTSNTETLFQVTHVFEMKKWTESICCRIHL